MRGSMILVWAMGCLGCAAAQGAPDSPLLVAAPGSPLAVVGGNVVAGDVNGDRHQDLLITDSQTGGLRVMLGDGKGGFAAAAGGVVALAAGSGEPAVGDVNSDGKPDVALVNHNSYEVVVLLGDGKAGFAAAPGSPFVAKDGQRPHTHGLAMGDLDGDGDLDLVTANDDDGDVAVLLGDGRGGFARAAGSPFACGPSPYPIALVDVNGDGKPDVLVPNSGPRGNQRLTILIGDGRGGFAPGRGSPAKVGGYGYFVAAGDLNGDGTPDAVVAHGDDDQAATVLLNDGRGGFGAASRLELGARAWGVVVTDMDGDRKADVVAACKDAVRVFLGDGKGRLRAAPGSPFATGKGTWRLAVADFNEDGKPDVAATCLEAGHVAVLLGK